MSAQDHLDQAKALSSAVLRNAKPSSVRQAWHLKKRVTKTQKQLDRVKQRITQEMRVLHEDRLPEVAAVGSGKTGCSDVERQQELVAYREAKNRINDLLLETWEMKFDLDEYIQKQTRSQQLDQDN